MKKTISMLLLLFCTVAVSAQVVLKRVGSRAYLEVKGRPMLILGGELSNSAATSVDDIDEVMPRMKAMGLNTVLVPAQWDLIEPEEGLFDFRTIDETIEKARENQLKVIFLWFGAWKNSMSCYTPLWFKKDTKRFPRAMTHQGKPLEIASAFSEKVFEADNRAFSRLIQHIKDIDAIENTVVMVQVENEIGMLEDARDHSPLAEKAFRDGEWRKKIAGKKWKYLPGDADMDEVFMAYYYAKYVERLAQSARKIYDIPLYVNAAMNSRGRKPGEYPSAGPLAHLADIWHLAAPSIDLLAPDIYDTGFKGWARQYDMGVDNPLFIPESRCCENSGVRALYVFGEHEAVGFSPFAIDQSPLMSTEEVEKGYSLIKELEPLLLRSREKRGVVRGVLFDKEDKETVIEDGDMVLTCRHYYTLPWDPRATDGSEWPEGGAIILKMSADEYIVAGCGVVVVFQKKSEKEQIEQKVLGEDGFVDNGNAADSSFRTTLQFKGKRVGLGSVDEVSVGDDGKLNYIRRLNGDQDHQGRHVRISTDEYKILHVKLYEY
ncbi:MAG: DUF5597 domain-containing protein [Prevotella sp.]|nr:DUF5597 domain-containing protein [Prevotella sp.]